MTERRGDQGFSVAPQRIGDSGPGGSGRSRRRLGLAVVVVAATLVFAVSWLGPRLTDRPNFDVSFFATPTPGASPSPSPTPVRTFPTERGATPLPEVTRPEGPVPTGQIAVQTGDLRIIDLATGAIVTGPRAVAGRDAVLRNPAGDGWTCVCFDDGETTGESGRTLRVMAIDPSGSSDATDLATYARPPSENGQADVATDVDLVTVGGRHRGLVAIATRNGGPYRFSVASIDVEGRTLGPSVELGTSASPPSPAPSADSEGGLDMYIDGPHVRISPGGEVAFVWGMVQRFDGTGGFSGDIKAWRVPLGADGSIGPVSVARGLLELPRFCGSVGFAAADRLAWLCPQFGADAAELVGTWEIGTVGLDGEVAGRNTVAAVNQNSYVEALFDRANGQVYAWDPAFLTISRYDAHTLVATSATFDPLVTTSPGLAAGGGAGAPEWRHPDSAVSGYAGTLTGGLDGERLYALGFDPEPAPDSGNQPSRGVFVIDRRTFALVDRWAPAADYITLTPLPGGYVAAAGLPGVKEDGHFAPWEASLTIHDATDGRILVRFGQLGADTPVVVVDR